MPSDIDPLKSIVMILTDNYTILNTDSITPLIAKIYEQSSSKTPNPNQDFIYVYSDNTSNNTVGINSSSNGVAEVKETLKIDVRSRPNNAKQANKTVDTHARKVLTEVYRILFSKIVNPDSDFDEINPNITHLDLSDGSRGTFRYVLKIEMTDYCRDRVS